MRSPQARARSSGADGNTVQRVRGVRRALSSSCGLVGMTRLRTAVVGAARARGVEHGVQRSVRFDSMPCLLPGYLAPMRGACVAFVALWNFAVGHK